MGVAAAWLGVYGETNAAPEAGAAGSGGEGKRGGDWVKGVANAPGIFGQGKRPASLWARSSSTATSG